MTQEHPITPPPELVQAFLRSNPFTPAEMTYEQFIATRFARWAADQELEACIKLLSDLGGDGEMIRRYRRPKPTSLKEQALKELKDWTDEKHGPGGEVYLCEGLSVTLLRKALESLPD